MLAESESRRARRSNPARAKACTSKGNPLHHILPFELFLRAVWPTDTVKKVGRITGKSERSIKYQLAGELPPSFTDAVAILRSEHGFEFLQHIIGDAKPKWWRGVQKARGLGDMRRQLAEQQRRIAQLEMAID